VDSTQPLDKSADETIKDEWVEQWNGSVDAPAWMHGGIGVLSRTQLLLLVMTCLDLFGKLSIDYEQVSVKAKHSSRTGV